MFNYGAPPSREFRAPRREVWACFVPFWPQDSRLGERMCPWLCPAHSSPARDVGVLTRDSGDEVLDVGWHRLVAAVAMCSKPGYSAVKSHTL